MQKFLRDPDLLGRGHPIIGVNSQEFTKADPVYADSNGWLDVIGGNSQKFLGYYVGQGETMESDNQTVDKKTPDYAYAGDVEMVFGSNQDATQTDIGAYADFGTVTTGAFELNLAAGSDGLMFVLGFDPDGVGDDDAVVVIIAEAQRYAYAQA